MITLKQSGSFSKTDAFLKRLSSGRYLSNLDKYAKEGLDALIAATPFDSGLTADSWYYQITESKDSIRIDNKPLSPIQRTRVVIANKLDGELITTVDSQSSGQL